MINSVQDNELDIVVGFFDAEFDEFTGGSLDRDRIAGQGGKGRRGLVYDGRCTGLKQIEDETKVASL